MSEPVHAAEFQELENEAVTEKEEGENPVVSSDQIKLDLVSDVRVTLDAVIGGVELPIHELFALKTGKVLDLDALVDGPILLRCKGHDIARGRLVVVGDNFGVEVTEVAALAL